MAVVSDATQLTHSHPPMLPACKSPNWVEQAACECRNLCRISRYCRLIGIIIGMGLKNNSRVIGSSFLLSPLPILNIPGNRYYDKYSFNMVSPQLFESYPAFPKDATVARVAKISLAKLIAGDESESLRMFNACRAVGFFLLDLNDEPVGEAFIQTISAMFGIVKEIFDLSIEEKEKYNMVAPHKLLGLAMHLYR